MKSIIFILALMGFGMMGCEEVVDINIQSFESALIVEGGIFHQKDGSSNQQIISLSSTVDFLDQGGAKAVTNAIVQVSDGLNTYSFEHRFDGHYEANIPTEIGKTYRLTIQYNNQTIVGSETLSDIGLIDSIYSEFEEETTFTDAGYFVKIDTRDLPNQENFYHWRLFIDDTLSIIPDPGNQANLIATDEFFDGQPIIGYKPNEEISLEIGEEVRIEQLGISEQYYEYLYQVFGQSSAVPIVGNPPPARIQGNVWNVTNRDQFVLGYFAVAALSKAEIIVSE